MTKRFSASVVGQYMACPGSANLDLAIPHWEEPVEDLTANNAANRGTDMHVTYAKVAELPITDAEKLVEAMAYTNALRRTRRFKSLVEEKMKATWLVSEPDTTADLVLYTQDELHILDLKTGKIPVEVVDNTQLLFGAVTYAQLAPRAKGATLHIVNPWASGCHSWYADTNVLQQFKDEAIEAERKVLAHDLTLSPGDHCTFCPANPHKRGAGKGKPHCPAMMNLLYPKLINEDEILAL